MELLPRTLGTRPRVAVELRPEGAVAARADADAAGLLAAVSRATLPEGALLPGLRAGNITAAPAVIAAVSKALDSVADKTRGREVTLIVPDAAVRVLFLDFEALPSKPAEAMPLVRFRLKKLIPFESEDASVSYQVMSSAKGLIRVLAVAMPREVLAEYEAVVREAGFHPGAVLPSTLAALAGLDVTDTANLVVNAGPKGITTAIVQAGILLLHRTVDMTTEDPFVEPVVSLPPVSLPLLDHETTAEEWSRQQPLPVGATAEAEAEAARVATMAEPSAVLEGVREELRELARTSGFREVAQAVSVAAAYFEDTLGVAPGTLFSVGTTNAHQLRAMLREADFGGPDLRVHELVEADALASTATAAVPHSWLAGGPGGASKLMRIAINLATRPYVELRPLFARLRLAMAVLAVLAVGLGIGLQLLNVRAAQAARQMEDLKARTAVYENERRDNEARMRQPGNRAVLERSQFLNALFAKKSFSWTAVMMDLETVLPAGVQVTSIDPSITKEGLVQIRLRVSGDRDRAVQLVRNLEGSHRFLSPRLANETAQTADSGGGLAGAPRGVGFTTANTTATPGGVEFDILSGYNPLPAAPVRREKNVATAAPSARHQGGPR